MRCQSDKRPQRFVNNTDAYSAFEMKAYLTFILQLLYKFRVDASVLLKSVKLITDADDKRDY